MIIEIQFLGGTRDGQRIDLAEKSCIRIGRHPDNDVTFDAQLDLNVSGHHAEIRQERDGYYLYDMGSSNGSFVNGAKVERARLASGQEIKFGPQGPRIVVRFVDDADTEASDGGMPVADTRVGAKTVAMMIDAAMREAKSNKRGGVGRSTIFMRSMINQAVTRSTRRFKLTILVLSILSLIAVGGLLTLRYVERGEATRTQQKLRLEMARLMEQQQLVSSAQKQRLAQRLDQLNQKLIQGPRAMGGRDIVRRNMRSVFLLAYRQPESEAKGFCTAFAVGRTILGTNAHCVIALEKYRGQGMQVFAVMNRDPAKRYGVKRVAHHPRYHKPRLTISRDVGLLELDGAVQTRVKLPTVDDLRRLDSGDLIYMYGFPGRLANPASPAATLVQGVIGRVTKLDGQLGSFEENQLIQHSAFTSGGTSGSPIFNQEGTVIAVNTGGYVEPGSLQIVDPATGRANRLMVTKQLAGYNFGIRIDVLTQLMADLNRKEKRAP